VALGPNEADVKPRRIPREAWPLKHKPLLMHQGGFNIYRKGLAAADVFLREPGLALPPIPDPGDMQPRRGGRHEGLLRHDLFETPVCHEKAGAGSSPRP